LQAVSSRSSAKPSYLSKHVRRIFGALQFPTLEGVSAETAEMLQEFDVLHERKMSAHLDLLSTAVPGESLEQLPELTVEAQAEADGVEA